MSDMTSSDNALPQDGDIGASTSDSLPDTSAQENSELDTGSSAPVQQEAQQDGPKMIEADRFNKLQSNYQRTLNQLRDYEGKQQYYQTLEREFQALHQQVQQGNQARPQAKDVNSMTPEEFLDYSTQKSLSAFEQRVADLERQKQYQAQQDKQNARQKAFNDRFNEVLAEYPDQDPQNLWDYMNEHEIWNPRVAYEHMHRDSFEKKVATQAKQEVTQKLVSNRKTKIEGHGKQGVIPQPEIDFNDKNNRVDVFTRMIEGSP